MMRSVLPVLTAGDLLAILEQQANPKIKENMKRFGVNPARSLGIRLPVIRRLAHCQKSHALALELWDSGIHEARLLAAMVDEVDKVTREQMDDWAADFDAWDVCDIVIIDLFHKTRHAFDCSREWVYSQPEYICRAGFVLMAVMAVHLKKLPDGEFLPFFPLILNHTYDDRIYVTKAANWALRQLGKRSVFLEKHALDTAYQLKKSQSSAARWAGTDAIRELENNKFRPSRIR